MTHEELQRAIGKALVEPCKFLEPARMLRVNLANGTMPKHHDLRRWANAIKGVTPNWLILACLMYWLGEAQRTKKAWNILYARLLEAVSIMIDAEQFGAPGTNDLNKLEMLALCISNQGHKQQQGLSKAVELEYLLDSYIPACSALDSLVDSTDTYTHLVALWK